MKIPNISRRKPFGEKEDERKIEQNCFFRGTKKMLKNKELGLKITETDFFKGKNVFQAIKSDEKKICYSCIFV